MEESVIKANVTKDSVIIRIPNEFVINTFNENYGDELKIKYKNKFLKEFAKEIVEQLVINEIIEDVNQTLTDGENVKWLCDEEE